MTTAKKATKVQVEEIAVEKLLVSQQETRKTLDQVALKELAASISANNVQEPLLVRPLRAVTVELEDGSELDYPPQSIEKIAELLQRTDVVRTDVDDTFYEIVAGQRRHAASQIAGKTTCPCIVREMSDAEAAELRIISNLQREDLPPLEEALAFSALLCAPGATIETVAAKLGKSPSFVGRRLKLLDAIESVREALKAGAIEVGHALELARLDEAQQLRLLSRLNCGFVYRSQTESEDDDANDWDPDEDEDESDDEAEDSEPAQQRESRWVPTCSSVADLRREIAQSTLRILSDAPFPLDAEMSPVSCAACTKRSSNAVLLFDDFTQDTCTDRDCFQEKVKVWIRSELQAADEEKHKLLMLSDGWTDNKAVIEKWDVTVVTDAKPVVPCKSQEEAIWISGKRAGHRAMICRDPKCEQHQTGHRGGHRESIDSPKAKADRKKLLAKVKAEKTYRATLFKIIAGAPGPDLQKAFDVMVTELASYAIGRSDSTKYGALGEATGIPKEALSGYERKKLSAELAKRPMHVRAMIALLATKDQSLTVHEYDITNAQQRGRKLNLEELAETIGVDWKALRKQLVEPKAEVKPKIEPMSPKAAKAWLANCNHAESPAETPVKMPAKKKAKPVAKKTAKASKSAKPAASRKVSPETKKRIAAAVKRRWADQSKTQTPKKGA
jgi:ParB family chromosome partitioning protein